ncbi:polycystin-1-like [Haliotis asinina]|uniref:polycystin-1-like n=1 Tax=Haliotis asinina TaxID=109174 RepID=UPI003531C9ED
MEATPTSSLTVSTPTSSAYVGVSSSSVSSFQGPTTPVALEPTTSSHVGQTSSSAITQPPTTTTVTTQPTTTSSTTAVATVLQPTSTLSTQTVKSYNGVIKVTDGATWNENLNDKNSDEYKQLQQKILQFLQQIFGNTNLAPYIDSIVITGFRQGSIVVEFEVGFSTTTVVDSEIAGLFNSGYQNIANPNYTLNDAYTDFTGKVPDSNSAAPIQQEDTSTPTHQGASTHVAEENPVQTSTDPAVQLSPSSIVVGESTVNHQTSTAIHTETSGSIPEESSVHHPTSTAIQMKSSEQHQTSTAVHTDASSSVPEASSRQHQISTSIQMEGSSSVAEESSVMFPTSTAIQMAASSSMAEEDSAVLQTSTAIQMDVSSSVAEESSVMLLTSSVIQMDESSSVVGETSMIHQTSTAIQMGASSSMAEESLVLLLTSSAIQMDESSSVAVQSSMIHQTSTAIQMDASSSVAEESSAMLLTSSTIQMDESSSVAEESSVIHPTSSTIQMDESSSVAAQSSMIHHTSTAIQMDASSTVAEESSAMLFTSSTIQMDESSSVAEESSVIHPTSSTIQMDESSSAAVLSSMIHQTSTAIHMDASSSVAKESSAMLLTSSTIQMDESSSVSEESSVLLPTSSTIEIDESSSVAVQSSMIHQTSTAIQMAASSSMAEESSVLLPTPSTIQMDESSSVAVGSSMIHQTSTAIQMDASSSVAEESSAILLTSSTIQMDESSSVAEENSVIHPTSSTIQMDASSSVAEESSVMFPTSTAIQMAASSSMAGEGSAVLQTSSGIQMDESSSVAVESSMMHQTSTAILMDASSSVAKESSAMLLTSSTIQMDESSSVSEESSVLLPTSSTIQIDESSSVAVQSSMIHQTSTAIQMAASSSMAEESSVLLPTPSTIQMDESSSVAVGSSMIHQTSTAIQMDASSSVAEESSAILLTSSTIQMDESSSVAEENSVIHPTSSTIQMDASSSVAEESSVMFPTSTAIQMAASSSMAGEGSAVLQTSSGIQMDESSSVAVESSMMHQTSTAILMDASSSVAEERSVLHPTSSAIQMGASSSVANESSALHQTSTAIQMEASSTVTDESLLVLPTSTAIQVDVPSSVAEESLVMHQTSSGIGMDASSSVTGDRSVLHQIGRVSSSDLLSEMQMSPTAIGIDGDSTIGNSGSSQTLALPVSVSITASPVSHHLVSTTAINESKSLDASSAEYTGVTSSSLVSVSAPSVAATESYSTETLASGASQTMSLLAELSTHSTSYSHSNTDAVSIQPSMSLQMSQLQMSASSIPVTVLTCSDVGVNASSCMLSTFIETSSVALDQGLTVAPYSTESVRSSYVETDECQSSPCPAHSTCIDLVGTHRCECNVGFVMSGEVCTDINECLGNPCPVSSTCENTVGSYTCNCIQGYVKDGDKCSDFDECDADPCPSNSDCSNTPGNYTCTCRSGFLDIGDICQDLNECDSLPCQQDADCINTQGSYYCVCKPGFVDDGALCRDVNECVDSPCAVGADCTNTNGNYTCACPPGYSVVDNSCTDQNECLEDPCTENADCTNGIGSYECACKIGFQNNSGLCQDVNECSADNPCPKNTVCENNPGSYSCPCSSGFSMSLGVCEDINECSSLPCPTYSTCHNSVGSFTCKCHNGFYQKSPLECVESKAFNSSVRLLEIGGQPAVYSSVYDDMNSPESQELSANFSRTLFSCLNQTLGDLLYGTVVHQFTEGSVIVNATIYVDHSYNGGPEELAALVQSNTDAFNNNGLVVSQSDTYITDVDECSVSTLNDCAPEAVCINDIGTYNCTCRPEFIDYSVDLPGRTCLVIDESNQDAVRGVTVATDKHYYKTRESVLVTIWLLRGSHVSYTLIYGDGAVETKSDPQLLAFLSPSNFSHSYIFANTYNVTVTSANDVSSVISTVQISVEEEVRQLKIDIQNGATEFEREFILSVASDNFILEYILCVFDYGDGNTNTTTINILSKMKTVKYTHAYQLGDFIVAVNCSNHVSSSVTSLSFFVEEAISDVNITTSKRVVFPGETFVLSIGIGKGSNISLILHLGDNRSRTLQLGNMLPGASTQFVTHSYLKPGPFRPRVKVSNRGTQVEQSLIGFIAVQNKVKDLSIETQSPVAVPPGEIDIVIKYPSETSPPSIVTCKTDIPSVTNDEYSADSISIGAPLSFTVLWTSLSDVGRVPFSVNCSNLLSYQVLQSEVLIQKAIIGFAATTSSLFIPIGGQVEFTIYVESGSHINYKFNFGDDSTATGVFQDLIVYKKSFRRVTAYNSKGIYDTSVTVFNEVSNNITEFRIGVLEEVKGLTATALYQKLDTSDALTPGHGLGLDVFPLERPVIINTTVRSGNDITYIWDFGDGTIERTSTRIHSHSYKTSDTYVVSVNATNALFYDAVKLSITTKQTILFNTLINNGPSDAYKNITFIANLARPGSESCFVFDMGDSTTPVLYGESPCSTNTDYAGYKYYAWSPTTMLYHMHTYTSNETFYVTLNGTNIVSEASIHTSAVISGVSCHYPTVHIIGGGQQIDEPVTRLRSDWLVFESRVDLDCEITNEAEYNWTILKVTTGENFLDFIFDPYPAQSESAGLFKILFRPRAFEPGDYKISLNVSMARISGLFHSDFTYLRILPTDIVARIKGGAGRAVGYDSTLELNAIEESYDPDAEDPSSKTHFTYVWWCRKEGESFEDSVDGVIEIPHNISGIFQNTSTGCFGTGIGKLPWTEGNVSFNTRQLEFDTTNIFRVEVTVGDRIASFEQAVTIVEGDPREFQLTCVVNCKSKVNPSGEFSLTSQCEKCHPLDNVYYNWTLLLYNDSAGGYLTVDDLDSMTSTGAHFSSVQFYARSLIGGMTYRLRLDANLHGYAPSFTEYDYITNEPPYGGTCVIVSGEAHSLGQRVIIRCQGWINPGEEEALGAGLLYRFLVYARGRGDVQLLYYGTDPYTPESQIPIGEESQDYMFDIVVRVANPIGEFVEVKLETQVKPPEVKENVDTYLNLTSGSSSTLSSLLATGREQEAKQLIVAVASLINEDSAKVEVSVPTGDTTTALPGASPTATTETEEELKQQKQKRVELRTEVVKTLATTDALTLDSLQQSAMAFRVITHQTTELSEEAQDVSVSTMSTMANTFQLMVEEDRPQSVEQELKAAEDIVAALGNIILAARTEATGSATNDTSPTDPSPTQGSSSSAWQADSESQAKAREVTKLALEVADSVVKTILKKQVPGAPPVVMKNQMFTVVAERKETSKLGNSVLSADEGSFKLPSSRDIVTVNVTSHTIDTKFVTSQLNPYVWDNSADSVNSPILTMNLYDSGGDEVKVDNLDSNIIIDIGAVGNDSNKVFVHPVLTGNETMVYHTWGVSGNNSENLRITVIPQSANVTLELYIRNGTFPTETEFDLFYQVPREVNATELGDPALEEELSYTIFVTGEEQSTVGNGTFYIGVKEQVNVSAIEPDYSDYYDYGNDDDDDVKVMTNYSISFSSSACRFWSEAEDKWITKGCQVSELSNSRFTRCLCNHLTAFASGVFTPPNSINFNTVFNNLGTKLLDNNAVLITLCVIFFLYIVCVIWARRKDKRDVERWGVAPLADNVLADKYFYQITVFTGMRSGAGTRSRVSFVLSGDDADTGVRDMADEKGTKVFNRGSVNQFVMGVSECLGPLSYLRVWHDNSGKGKQQSWYLSKVVVSDLQTGESFFFLCNRWLAVEEDDGMIDRVMAVAGTGDVLTFNHLFFSNTKKSLTDSHLWISVFARPQRSNFTRVQRVSCILSLLATTMLADAMFYKAESKHDAAFSFTLGPLKFSLNELYVSFVSSLVVLPVNILIDQIFRRCKTRTTTKVDNGFLQKNLKISTLRPSSSASTCPDPITTVYDGTLSPDPATPSPTQGKPSNPLITSYTRSSGDITLKTNRKIKKLKAKPNRKKKKYFPWWTRYIAWMLVFISTGVSAFFTFLYSMEWGKVKSNAWLSSMLLSVGQSVLLLQPIKIIVVAVIVAWVIKKPELDDLPGDEDPNAVQPQQDEVVTHEMPPESVTRPKMPVPQLDQEALQAARTKRLKEIEMMAIIKEVVAYVLYLIILFMVSVHNRDPNSFLIKDNLLNMIAGTSAFTKVTTGNDFWNWTRHYLLPNLYANKHFDGSPLEERGQRFVSNMVAYRVGPLRFRQHRVVTGQCHRPPDLPKNFVKCSHAWSWERQDTKLYLEGWQRVATNVTPATPLNYPWGYKTFSKTNGIPHVGKVGVYPAGGYVADLIGSEIRVSKMVDALKEKEWIDKYTRVVFAEFTVYNPNVNMFAMIMATMEIMSTGSSAVDVIVRPFRLFSYLGGYGVVVAICDALSLVFIVYFFVRECKILKKQKWEYFRHFWNFLELSILLLSLTTVAMYVGRHLMTTYAISKVTKLRDRFYNFQRLAMWDELFTILLAFVIFVSMFKIIHMLRFNKKMSMLAGTLRKAAQELSAFSVVFVCFIIAFMSLGFLTFGANVEGYSSVLLSLETLLSFALGHYQFEELSMANRTIGPIFFFAYIMFVVLLMLNMFVTILNDSFSVVRTKVNSEQNDYEIVSFMWECFRSWIDLTGLVPKAKGKYSDKEHSLDNDQMDDDQMDDDQPKTLQTAVTSVHKKLDNLERRLDAMSGRQTFRKRQFMNTRPDIDYLDMDLHEFTRIFPQLTRLK